MRPKLRRKHRAAGYIAFLLGLLIALIAGLANAEEWKSVGEDTFIRNFNSPNGPFTCIMVMGGGGMAGEVKTVACPGVIYVPIKKEEPVPAIPSVRRVVPESWLLPALPKQKDAQTQQAPPLD